MDKVSVTLFSLRSAGHNAVLTEMLLSGYNLKKYDETFTSNMIIWNGQG
jgi:hypothetical protein